MNQNKYHVDEFNINNEEIAFISDTHLGSINENIDAINKAFDIINKHNIKTIFHLGDLVDGTDRYSVSGIKIVGGEEQAKYFINKYPYISDITTYCLRGNHDYSHLWEEKFDVIKYITSKRKDIITNDYDMFQINSDNTRILLKHYFIDEEIKKYVQEQKINILLQGHYHNFKLFENIQPNKLILPTLSNEPHFIIPSFVIANFNESFIEFQNYIFDEDNTIVKKVYKK